VHRIGSAVPGLGRGAGGVLLQVVDDAVVGVPGIGIVDLGRAGVAVVEVAEKSPTRGARRRRSRVVAKPLPPLASAVSPGNRRLVDCL
jgi:hypothetical protein